MKLSEYIEKYGDCEVTGEIDKCIVKMPKTVYDLKYGDGYFFLTVSGAVQRGIWCGDSSDFNRKKIGNTFLTEKDAKFASERLKVIAELKKYAKEFSDEEWMDNHLPKYHIGFEYGSRVLLCYRACWCRGLDLYFESSEKAKEAIGSVGEDRIKKYYLGVKE